MGVRKRELGNKQRWYEDKLWLRSRARSKPYKQTDRRAVATDAHGCSAEFDLEALELWGEG